jgi:hypothetical protein
VVGQDLAVPVRPASGVQLSHDRLNRRSFLPEIDPLSKAAYLSLTVMGMGLPDKCREADSSYHESSDALRR